MRPLVLVFLIACSLSAPPATPAQTLITPADRSALELTVYSGFAQVRDTRRANLSGGAAVVTWTGVPSSLDPGTILLTADGRPATVRMLSFAGERSDPESILSRHVGQEVILVGSDGQRISATLVSPDGPVFRVGDHLVLGWKGHIEVPAAPEGEIAERAIRFQIDAPDGSTTLAADYLADALSWSADYVAVLEDDATAMRLEGRVTVENGTDFAYPDAGLRLVAGDLRREGGGPIPFPTPRMAEMAARSDADIERAPLGDYHLYSLAEPVTIGALETVQLPLFEARSVAVQREYALGGQMYFFHGRYPEPPEPQHPEIRLAFTNDFAGRDPLPAGTLHTYTEGDDGRRVFTGDATIPGTPTGERIDVTIGSAFDLVAERTQTDYQQLDPNTHESAWRIEIRNRGETARTVTVYEPLAGDWTIVEESAPHQRLDAQMVRWMIPVPAGAESVLTYRVRATTP